MTENFACSQVHSSLEAYLFDDLEPEARRRLESHVAACASCADEIGQHRRVEELVRAVYRDRLEAAAGPSARSAASRSRPAWIGVGAVAAAAVLAGGLFLWTPSTPEPGPDTAATEIGEPEKADDVGIERAKPEDATPVADGGESVTSIPVGSRETFALEDPAGYVLSLEDFRGSALVVGVLTTGDGDAFRKAYEQFRGTEDLRFVGVPAGSEELGPGIPLMRNRGVSVLDTPAGGFVLVDREGVVNGRGEVSDPDFDDAIERWIGAGFRPVRVE